jgi:hypothetical protein
MGVATRATSARRTVALKALPPNTRDRRHRSLAREHAPPPRSRTKPSPPFSR